MRYTIFSDESATRERFLGFGGIILPSKSVAKAEALLESFCGDSWFGDREMSWKNCSPREVERYCEFADQFLELQEHVPPIDFRTMVVDTERHPLKHPASGAVDDELGFYKFYHQFLQASLRVVASDPTGFRIVIAPRQDRYPFNAEILEKTVGGVLRRLLRVGLEFTEVAPGEPHENRLHQLADVLLGAVTYRFNQAKRDPRGKSHKRTLCEQVEQIAGQRLDRDVMPSERPFNVWAWAPKGGRRWVDGSEGTVT